MSHLYVEPFLNCCIYVFLLFQNTSLFVGVKRFCVVLDLHQRGSLISRLLHKSVSQHTMKRAVALTKKRENDCVHFFEISTQMPLQVYLDL